MINKQGLWFITLFSLLIILGVYYVTIPDKSLTVFADNIDVKNNEDVTINKSTEIIAMKVEVEEKISSSINDAKNILLSESASSEEKNKAFNTIQSLNKQKSIMQKIEDEIKEKFNANSCVQINDDKITINIELIDQGNQVATQIMEIAQKYFEEQKYITVNFKDSNK